MFERLLQEQCDRQEKALRMIGYSATTGQPRFGPKAQCARWGLGEDTLPEEYESLGTPDDRPNPPGCTFPECVEGERPSQCGRCYYPEEQASLDDEAIRAIYDRGYVDGLDDGYKSGTASLASRIGGAAARLEEFVETGDTEVLLEGLPDYDLARDIARDK